MKNLLSLLALLVLLPGAIWGQKYTLSGTVKDAGNGEDLIGATIFVKELSNVGAFSNEYGFFSLTLPEGDYTAVFRYIGYETQEIPISLSENRSLNIELEESSRAIDTVQITAELGNENVSSSEMSVLRLSPKEVENIPVLFGERDIVKTLQLLPGVKPAGEGNSGFYVRGGSADQNLILLDEAPVYNASHLLGFFSVFNSDALKDVTLYKGGMPAEYGGRVSSVMDVRMKEGNKKGFHGTGGVGIIASRLTLEAPIVKDKGSFIVSGRRTYADLFLKLSQDTTLNSTALYFYDFNAKANYQINDRNRIFASGYFGRDVFSFGDQFGFDWGNATATVRWNHLFSEKVFSNTSFIYSNYGYRFRIGDDKNGFGLSSSIRDFNIKEDLTWLPNPKHTVKFGLQAIYHRFIPGELEVGSEVTITPPEVDSRYAIESAAYIQDDYTLNQRISISYGLRYSLFSNVGPGNAYDFDTEGNITNTETYGDMEVFANSGGFEPRLSARYLIDEKSSVKGSLNRNYQYIHLLSNSVSTSPTDVYVPTSNYVKPQIADQVAVGYFRNFLENKYEFSVETYYKWLQNQIDYRNGADLILNNTVESELVFGKGRAYGLEFLLRKRSGRLTGWFSYTLSRSLRTFEQINEGDEFPARQDRIHDLSLTLVYELTKRTTISTNFVFYTGEAVTFPSGRYDFEGISVPYYTERNGYRFPEYHRLDLGVSVKLRQTEKWKSDLNFSLYNTYARENAFTISFQEDPDNPGTTQAVRLALFKIVPSISYDFEF